MKNQYFGDIGDYGKYSLLRAFAKEGIRIGVNWYLTEDDDSADGKHTDYLRDEREERYDPELFACLKRMVDSGKREVKLFEEQNMIPGAVYYHDLLDISRFETTEEKRKERERWHASAMDALQDSELVFLDPDNGITACQSNRKDSVKYAFADEAADYYERGKNVVYYCQRGRRTASQWEETKQILCRRIPSAAFTGVLFHRGTQRAFLFAIHREDYERYNQILTAFLGSVWSEHFSPEFVHNMGEMPGTGFAAPVIGTPIPKDWIRIDNPDGTIKFVPPEECEQEAMKKEKSKRKMKYYILEGNMKPDVPQGPEFKKILDAHHAFMEPYFEAGKILTSGPLVGGRGGVILLRLEDDETVEDFIAKDPFTQSGIQEYRITQFNVFQIQEYAKAWTE